MFGHVLPPFDPHPLFRGGDSQTLAGAYLPGTRHRYRAERRLVPLSDGDQLVLHDDCPANWGPEDRAALLIHGLGGSHDSGYMRRIGAKLNARGVRAFRMDLRGCGAGMALARLPYHSGRSDDARAAIERIAAWCPRAPLTLLGFSLGANIALKLLGELEGGRCGNLDSAMAVCPPVDLATCSRQISMPRNRLYDRFFLRHLLAQIAMRRRLVPGAVAADFCRRPRTLWEFDDQFTAPTCGFEGAEDYYQRASSAPFLARIRTPTLILASLDDPMIPSRTLQQLSPPKPVEIHFTRHGGHLGFVGRSGCDPDRRWMDWRVVDWVLTQNRVAVPRDEAVAG